MFNMILYYNYREKLQTKLITHVSSITVIPPYTNIENCEGVSQFLTKDIIQIKMVPGGKLDA